MPYKDPEKRREVKRKWREKNGTEYARKYRTKHKNKINKNQRKYYNTHKEEVHRRNKNWKNKNPERRRESNNRHNSKRRRNLGYEPINKKEVGNVGHHIDKNLVIYIPENMHKIIPHAQKNLESMKNINIIAIQVAYI